MSNLDVYKLRHVDQGEVCHQVRHCATPNTIANISNLSFVDKGRGSHFAPINFSRTYRLSYFRPFRPHCQMDAEQAQLQPLARRSWPLRTWPALLQAARAQNKGTAPVGMRALGRCGRRVARRLVGGSRSRNSTGLSPQVSLQKLGQQCCPCGPNYARRTYFHTI